MRRKIDHPYTPPASLRWLATLTDAATCEVADYAAKALERTTHPPRAVIEKAIGRAETESLIAKAIDLGRAFLNEASMPSWVYVQGAIPQLGATRAELRVLAQASKQRSAEDLSRIAEFPQYEGEPEWWLLARKALRVAFRLEGNMGRAAIHLAALALTMKEGFRVRSYLHPILTFSPTSPLALFAASLGQCQALGAGAYSAVFSYDTSCAAHSDRIMKSILESNKTIASVYLGDVKNAEYGYSQCVDHASGTWMEERIPAAIEEVRNALITEHAPPRELLLFLDRCLSR